MVDLGHRVLPDQFFLRHFRAQVTFNRAHVPVGELVPGAGKGVGELFRIFIEPAGDLAVLRIETQRQVGGQHGRLTLLGFVLGVGNVRVRVLGHPLLGTGRALFQFPFVLEQVVEEQVGPLGGLLRPGHFRATADGVVAETGAVAALPAQAHHFNRRRFRLRAHQFRVTGAVGFTEGVATGDQRHGLFVVHRHAAEGFADVVGRFQRIRLAVGAFRVHVDQTHLHRRQRVFQLAVAGVALVVQPGIFHAPVDVVFGFVEVLAAAGETEGFETHGFQRHVTGEHDQIGPGDLVAVLFLNRPQQTAGLVQVDVVRPAVERREPLRTGTRAAPAVADAVGAGAVPGHANEHRAVVAKVRRPPVLGVGHQISQVFFQRRQIQAFEGFRVIKVLVHRVGHGRMLMQDVQPQLIRPPIPIGDAAARDIVVMEGTFALGHDRSPCFSSRGVAPSSLGSPLGCQYYLTCITFHPYPANTA